MMGDPMDPELDKDFDFAGNLALFDKAVCFYPVCLFILLNFLGV